MNTKDWRALIRNLRRCFPTQGAVRVLRRPRVRHSGMTIGLASGDFRIYVDSLGDPQSQVDTLLHEWAHVLAIEEAYEHRGRWSAFHGEIYDAWARDFNTGETE